MVRRNPNHAAMRSTSSRFASWNIQTQPDVEKTQFATAHKALRTTAAMSRMPCLPLRQATPR